MTKPWNAPAAAIEESSADEHVQRCQISAGIVNLATVEYWESLVFGAELWYPPIHTGKLSLFELETFSVSLNILMRGIYRRKNVSATLLKIIFKDKLRFQRIGCDWMQALSCVCVVDNILSYCPTFLSWALFVKWCYFNLNITLKICDDFFISAMSSQ